MTAVPNIPDTSVVYAWLSVEDKLALLALIEREARSADDIHGALLATERVLNDLDVFAGLEQVGHRLKACLGCSLRQLALAYYELRDANHVSFYRLAPPLG